MSDRFMIAIVQKLCQDYNWRFNSSENQMKYGTISIIIKGKVFEISKDYILRQRRIIKSPTPYTNSHSTNSNIKQFNSVLEAVKFLHTKYGNDTIEVPTYYIKYKHKYDKNFINIEANDFNDAKLKFKQLIRELNITNCSPFKEHKRNACAMLIERYGDVRRLVDIRNTCLNIDEVNKAIN